MKKWTLAIAATSVVTAVVSSWATRSVLERPVLDDSVEHRSLRSAVLGEDREFVAYLPASYAREPGSRYPVIYVLDGDSQHIHTADSAALMARIGVMPEVIVVGIPPVNGERRQRDYTPPGMPQDSDLTDGPDGGADRFLAFLRDELIPRIDRDYRTSGPRMLAGNWRGGLFVVYSLLAAPSLFDARFAHSPALWRDNDAMVARLDRFLASWPAPNGFLFLSLGDRENEKMTAAFNRTIDTLERRAPPSLRWHAELSRGGDHSNNARYSTPVGLYALFAKEGSALPK